MWKMPNDFIHIILLKALFTFGHKDWMSVTISMMYLYSLSFIIGNDNWRWQSEFRAEWWFKFDNVLYRVRKLSYLLPSYLSNKFRVCILVCLICKFEAFIVIRRPYVKYLSLQYHEIIWNMYEWCKLPNKICKKLISFKLKDILRSSLAVVLKIM